MNLESVCLSETVSSIGNGAFLCCVKLPTITIPNNVTSIGKEAFQGCLKLFSVTLSNSIDIIEEDLFSGCESLVSITIPDNVSSIEDGAFNGCKNLTNINIPTKLTSIGRWAFLSCHSLSNIYLPNGLTTIGYQAFYECKNLSKIVIPNSVSYIGRYAFAECVKLKDVIIEDGDGDIYTPIKDKNYNKDFSEIATFKNSPIETFYLGKNYTNLSLKNIGTLLTLTIGRNATCVENSAFSGCDRLKDIYSLNYTPPQIFEGTFDNETEKNATLYVPMGCKNIYWLHPYWENFAKIEEIEVNEDITEKKSKAIVKYNEGIALYNNYMEFDSNVRSAYDKLRNQQDYNRKLGDEIDWGIYELKGKVEASDFDAELKAYFLNVLDSIDNVKYGYIKWTYEYGYDYLISELNNAKKGFESYAERLETYKSSIESATTNAELEAIIEQMGIDNSNMGAEYRSYWETDYNSLQQFIDSCEGYEAELLKLLQRLKDLKTEFDNITSGIETIASTNGNIIVYTLKGERMTIKSTQIKTLPKGIYIVNGKKYIVR